MLILTRRIGELVRIGDNIFLEVKGIQRNQVRLGIKAPKEILVFREEIYQPSIITRPDFQESSS